MELLFLLVVLAVVIGAILGISALSRRAPPRPKWAAIADELPAAKPAREQPMVVTEMATRGFLRITGPEGAREEPLPESPLGAGEFPMGIWVAPDHTVLAVGKLYTGKPGPDDGVIWKRTREGAWSIALRMAGPPIGPVAGRTADEVVIGMMGGVATWDGAEWKEHALPGATAPTTPREEPRKDRYTVVRDGIEYRVFDRSTPIGQRALAPHEEAEIRREMKQVQQALAEGKGRPVR